MADTQNQEPVDQTGVDETAEARKPLNVTVEDIGPARKALTIEIPAERIAEKIASSFDQYRTEAVIPGFRRGRAPKRLMEKRFGQSIRDEVRTQILAECYNQAIDENKLDVIGEPEVKDVDKIKLPESGPLSFRIEVEVSPKIELPALEGIAVSRPAAEVTEATIAAEIERLRENFGRMVEAKDAAAGEGDYVLANVRILEGADAADDAAEIANHPGAYILVPGESRNFKGHVAGIVINDLGKLIAGKKPGEVLTVSMTGPAGHEDDRIKDQPITLKIKLDRIERLEPAPVEDLARNMGLETAEQVNDRVKQMLESRRDREQKTAMHQQVLDYLHANTTVELPEGLSRRQAGRILHRTAMELAYRGVPQQDIEQRVAELRTGSEEHARKQLKQFFILDKAATDLDVDVTEAEVNGSIAMLAMQQGRRPEKLRQEMQRQGQIEQVYLQVREQKTLDKILEKAAITDAAPEAKSDSASA